MRSRNTIFLTFLFLFSAIALLSSAQNPNTYKSPPKKFNLIERLDFGGYIGAQFGDVIIVEISPLVIFRATDKFHTGFGFTYQYFNDTYYDYQSSAYGVNLLARYYVWRDLFAHAEYAPVYISDSYYSIDGRGLWVHDFMIGGGYRQWIGERAYITLMMLFNVNEVPASLYRNPIIKIGFGVGI